MTKLETRGDVPGKGAEALTHRLLDRLQCLEAVAVPGSMDAGAFGRTMVDRDEHRSLPLAGHDRRHVRAPHLVNPLGDDRAIMSLRATRPARTLMRQKTVLSHQP